MYILIVFFILRVLAEGLDIQQCNDCINFKRCPEALVHIENKKTIEDIHFLKSTFCGFDITDIPPAQKVCCSKFSKKEKTRELREIPEDKRIANHENLKLLPAKCGLIKGNRIVGGQKADLYEFPWMVIISYNTRDGERFKCGGSIINKRYVLTAAHCVMNQNIATVRIGEYDLNTDIDCQNNVCERHLQELKVENRVVHEKYDSSVRILHDIALLRLADDIDFNHKNVHRICLPTTSELRNQDLSNKIATVIGWGLTENGTYPSVLRKVDVPIFTSDNCSRVYNRFTVPGAPDSTENQLCAGIVKRDSCTRDSGGPLMLEQKLNNTHRYVQYGLVSYGPYPCGSDEPGAYVDVTKYMGWILDNISP